MRIIKRFSWAMAHRLGQGYKGKCKNIHGHTYHCEVTLDSDEADAFGMVVDFGEIKKTMQAWVDEHLDHAVLITSQDKQLERMLVRLDSAFYVMPDCYCNPTAENIAQMLFDIFDEMATSMDIFLKSVKVWETDTACAEYAAGAEWRKETSHATEAE